MKNLSRHKLQIGSQIIQHKVLFTEIVNEGIFGLDFLTTNHCDLMLAQKCMKLNGKKNTVF